MDSGEYVAIVSRTSRMKRSGVMSNPYDFRIDASPSMLFSFRDNPALPASPSPHAHRMRAHDTDHLLTSPSPQPTPREHKLLGLCSIGYIRCCVLQIRSRHSAPTTHTPTVPYTHVRGQLTPQQAAPAHPAARHR